MWPLLLNITQVIVDLDGDAGLFPRLTLGGLLACLVRLPAALGQNPAFSAGRLDQQHIVLIGGEGHDAGDETLSFGVVAYIGETVSVGPELHGK